MIVITTRQLPAMNRQALLMASIARMYCAFMSSPRRGPATAHAFPSPAFGKDDAGRSGRWAGSAATAGPVRTCASGRLC
jgi:hypothetical protein